MNPIQPCEVLWTPTLFKKISPRMRRSHQEWLGVVTVKAIGASSNLEPMATQSSRLKTVARGGAFSVSVHPQTLFRTILEDECDGFFLFHNHPSGSAIPSSSDLELTSKVIEASRMLELIFLGHAIVTSKQLHWIDLETVLQDCYGPLHHEHEFESDPLPH